MASSSSSHSILGKKLFDGKTKTIYSLIDQPNLICIHRKDHHDLPGSTFSIPGSRRSSIDSTVRYTNYQSNQSNTSNTDSQGALTTSITACVYEILHGAFLPTFYVAPYTQSDMFIAKKCTMIPILWIIRRLANEAYVKRNPGIVNGHRFIPPLIEVYYKRHSTGYRHSILENPDDNLESDHESQFDDDESDFDECISSIWSYEQLLNANIDTEHLKLSHTDFEYMYEICCTVFDILEHVWMVKKHCQLIDLKIEFGMTTTTTKEIVIANIYDVETWHLLRPIERLSPVGNDLIQENLIWINNSLRDILDLNITIPLTAKMVSSLGSDEQQKSSIIPEYERIDLNQDNLVYSTIYGTSITSRCVIICSSSHDIEHGQKIKTTLTDTYNIQCDIRLYSINKSTQSILTFLSTYSYEHCRPTVIVTLGNMNNGLAMCLSSNSQYPVIHCLLITKEQHNHLFDMNSFVSSNDTSLFTTVFTLPSAIQNVVQILAMNDWKLWTKLRGQRFKKYMDFIMADQQLLAVQTIKTINRLLIQK